MSDSIPVEKSRPKGWVRRWIPACVLFLLLSIRLALLVPAYARPGQSVLTDSTGYLDLAQSLRTQGTFDAEAHTEGIRTPGYPIFIATVQGLAGPGVGPVIVAQVLLAVAVAGLLFAVGRASAGSTVGWAAAVLWALNPNSIFWPFAILSETLFAVLIAGCLTSTVLALRRGSLRLIALSGLLLGMAVLVRPIGLYLIPVWCAVLLFRGVRSEGWRRGWRAPAVMALLAGCLVLGWSVRNLAVHKEFFFSKVSGSTLRSFILARALADARGISRSDAAQLISETSDSASVVGEIFAESAWSLPKVIVGGFLRTALGIEAETWLSFVGLRGTSQGLLTGLLGGDLASVISGVSRIFSTRDSLAYGVVVVWGLIYAVYIWLAAGWGWIRNHAQLDGIGATAHWLAALTTLYLVAVPLANGDARFRMPVDPLLAFMAGIAWFRWSGFRWRRPTNFPISEGSAEGAAR